MTLLAKVTVPISLGKFKVRHEFAVARSLTTDCTLGADFLLQYGAMINCSTGTLTLGDSFRLEVPVCIVHGKSKNTNHIMTH